MVMGAPCAGEQDVVRRQHQRGSFNLRFRGDSGMWTAIWSPSKIGVEGGANQGGESSAPCLPPARVQNA